LGTVSLGKRAVMESTVCVGAAKSVAGARAKMSEMVLVKIIVEEGIGDDDVV
jgi:hypothetical protein